LKALGTFGFSESFWLVREQWMDAFGCNQTWNNEGWDIKFST